MFYDIILLFLLTSRRRKHIETLNAPRIPKRDTVARVTRVLTSPSTPRSIILRKETSIFAKDYFINIFTSSLQIHSFNRGIKYSFTFKEHNRAHIEHMSSWRHWEFSDNQRLKHPDHQCREYCKPSSKHLVLSWPDDTDPGGRTAIP